LSDIIVGLDIGSSFIRTVIGEFTQENSIQIIGLGKAPSPGLRNGTIVNIEATMQAVKKAMEDAELSSGYEVKSCIAAIGGSQIESFDSRGVVVVSSKGNEHREITKTDIKRVLEMSRGLAIPPDRQILHVLPRYYIVDNQIIKNPENRLGVRLEAETHLVTASSTSMKNLRICIDRAGYAVNEIKLKTLAATVAVMTADEMEIGSILIDMGGGTTDVLVVIDGAPICSLSIPVGSSYVTNDIAIVKGISFETAERIKLNAGCTWEPFLEENENVLIPGVGGRSPEEVPRRETCEIIQARIQEIFNMIRSEIVKKTKLTQLSGNVVLTGGGAMLPGIVEMAQYVFKTTSVRLGVPGNLGGIVESYRTPEYATAVGLLVSNFDVQKHIDTNCNNKYNEQEMAKKSGNKFGDFLSRVFGEFF